MQEVFEKIIDEIKNIMRRPCGEENCQFEESCCENIAFMKAIEIVKQEAAEYNNGWIPCSERLPENISTVILQVEEIEKPTFGFYGNMNGWRLTEKDFVELKDFTVIAWQPLPPEYQPKGE